MGERGREKVRERERGNETQQRGAAHSKAARHITSLLSTPEEAELGRGERRHSPLHLLSDNVSLLVQNLQRKNTLQPAQKLQL